MSCLLVNKSSMLDRKTLSILLKSCGQIEDIKDRALLVAGMYAITVESIIPVSEQLES